MVQCKEINTDYLMIRWLSILILLSLLGCGEDKLELGIEGKVLGESGQPIPAATVKINGPESQSVVTDTDGRFFVGDILAGTYQISVNKTGYKIYSGNVQVLEKIATADVVLEKEDSQTISGVVRDRETSQPMPNVQLTTDPVTYSVTSDDQGAYKFGQKMKPANYTIMAKAEGYEPAMITVEVVLGEPTRADISMGVKPVLYVQPDVLQFGNTATNKVLTIQNQGTGQLIWLIGVPTEDWLQVTPLKGNTREVASTISITVDRRGLKPNPPPATLTITSNGGNREIKVTLDVDPEPVLYVEAENEEARTLHFNNQTTNKVLTIQNQGTGQLIWSIRDPAEDWLQVTPLKGNTQEVASTISITVNRDGLKPDPPPAILTITSNGGNREIQVTVDVDPKPVLYVEAENEEAETLDFGNQTTNKVLTIQNRGTGQLIWSIGVPGEDWLQVSPLKGVTQEVGSSVNITVNRDGLKLDPAPATLIIDSDDGGTKEIRVILQVDPNPEISVSTTELDFGKDRESWDFLIRNAGTGRLEWKIAVPENWATVTPTEGLTQDTPTSVNVRIDREAVTVPRKYQQDTVITSNGGTAKLTLLMEILPRPKLKVSINRIDFGLQSNQQVLLIENSGTGDLNWKIDLPAVKWLEVSRTRGRSTDQNPVSVEITVDRTKVDDPGTYEKVLTVSGEGMVIEIPVVMVVDRPKIVVDPSEIKFEASLNKQTVVLSREGLGRIDWQLAANADWLSIMPKGGRLSDTPIDLVISIDKKLMVQGINQASIEIQAKKAVNSPLIVGVKAEVLPSLRLIVKNQRSKTPVKDAQILEGKTDRNGIHVIENIKQPLVKGIVTTKGFIDQPFSFQLNQTRDSMIEKVIYLQPIPQRVTVLKGIDLDVPKEVAISSDGAFVYVTNNFGHSVTKIRTSVDQIVKTLDLSPDGEEPLGLTVNRLTGEIYVANSYVPPVGKPVGGVMPDTVSIISVDFNQSQKIVVGNAPTDVAVDADQKRLYVSNRESGNISIIDLGQRKLIDVIHVDNTPGRLELVDSELYCATEVGVAIINTRLKQVTKTIRNVGLGPIDLVSDNKYLYVVNNLSGDISIVSLSKKTVVQTVKVGSLPVRAAIGQDGILYVVNQGDSTVSIVSQLGGQFTVAEKTLSVGFNPLGIAVLPDGSKLYLVLQEDSVIEVFGYE